PPDEDGFRPAPDMLDCEEVGSRAVPSAALPGPVVPPLFPGSSFTRGSQEARKNARARAGLRLEQGYRGVRLRHPAEGRAERRNAPRRPAVALGEGPAR